MAPEGTYVAALSIDYAQTYQSVTQQSKSFVLALTPPAVSISLNPPQFVPTEKGVAGPMTLTIDAHSPLAKIESWSLDIYDEAGGLFKSFKGSWPDAAPTWDGKSVAGAFVVPTKTYKALATVQDEYGNSSELKADIPVAGLAIATPPKPAKKELVAVEGKVEVVPETAGFSPNGDKVMDDMTLMLAYGQPAAVKSWELEIADSTRRVQKIYRGDASHMPARVTWDGTTDNGKIAGEGSYTAKLSIDYGTLYKPASASSEQFILAVTPPTGSISLSTPLFSPIESSDTITLKLDAHAAAAKIDSWNMDIYDPGGSLFRSFKAAWPANQVVWNGKGSNGDMVQSAEDYPVVARIQDEFGNVGEVKSMVPIDILVEKMPKGYRILASRVFFKAFTADYEDVAPELAQQNAARLDALAKKLQKFPGYKSRIVGHAVKIFWDNPALGDAEQKEILIPLSKARADAVKKALVDRGLDAANLTTDGVGASDQLVPDSNIKDRWQNRRVALFLEKD
jgi:outer membrane protein OmpA-like peptidoglycan-associated protein